MSFKGRLQARISMMVIMMFVFSLVLLAITAEKVMEGEANSITNIIASSESETFTEEEPNNNREEANIVDDHYDGDPPYVIYGSITEYYFDLDFFRFDVVESGTFRISGIWSDQNYFFNRGDEDYLAIVLEDENEKINVAELRGEETGTYRFMEAEVSPGTYYIVVYQFSDYEFFPVGEEYEISVEFYPEGELPEPEDHDIKLSAFPEGAGEVEGTGTYEQGEEITVTAEPNEDYSFVNWTENDTVVSTDEAYTFEVDDDRVLVANFIEKEAIIEVVRFAGVHRYATAVEISQASFPYEAEIELLADPEEAGEAAGAGTYDFGEEVTVTAVAYKDYTFVNWTEDGVEVSTDESYTFEVEEDRVLTANFEKEVDPDAEYDVVGISQNSFPDRAEAVVLAQGDDFPDALAGVPLAYEKGGPLLLTRSDKLPDETAHEIDRLLKEGDTVYVLGGEEAISADVADELDAMNYGVERLAGEGRFDTAVKIAEEVADNPAEVFLTTGLDFPDAVAASGPAAMKGAPILLTTPDELSEETESYLAENEESIENIHVIGGETAVSDNVMEVAGGANRVSGAGRWETGTAIAEEFFEDPEKATLATGLEFPDAVAGGVYAALNDAPVILSARDELPEEVEDYFIGEETIIKVSVFGGDGAISDDVLQAIQYIDTQR